MYNIVQPHLLFRKLDELNVLPLIIRWYHSFLTNHKQQVRLMVFVAYNSNIYTHPRFTEPAASDSTVFKNPLVRLLRDAAVLADISCLTVDAWQFLHFMT